MAEKSLFYTSGGALHAFSSNTFPHSNAPVSLQAAATVGTVTDGECDLATGCIFELTPSAATTISVTNAPSGQDAFFQLRITDGYGLITFPSGDWSGGSVPVLSSAGTDIITVHYTSTGDWEYTFTNSASSISVTSLIASLPAHYERDVVWAVNSSVNTTLDSPEAMTVNVGGVGFQLTAQQSIDLTTTASWDSSETTYATAANRAGLDFYIYACNNSGTLALVLSHNSTYPNDYTSATSRKIGGFHCLCADVGTISGHTLSGYVAGDILPASVWDLKHRPVCDPAGMVYSSTAKLWADIYLASGTGSSTASVKGGAATVSRNWMDFGDDLGAVGKRLLTDYEFQLIAADSNEETNITGSAAPTDGTGGHVDTNSRRMISNCGCEECSGYLWQWLLDQSYRYDSSTWSWKPLDGDNGSLYSQDDYGDVKLLAGGGWGGGSSCGSRCRSANGFRWYAGAGIGGRGCARSLGA